MKIHVYSIMWNEEVLLPYFLRHYSGFADRIFVINDHSTDKTVEIAKKNKKVILLDFEYSRGLNENDFNRCFTDLYKKYSRKVADWVMCVDGDEFIYNESIRQSLETQRKNGVQIIKTTAYQMISDKIPQTKGQIYKECCWGLRSRGYDKPVVFDPALDITFGEGRHTIKSSQKIGPQWGKLCLLHYRYLSRDYYLKRSLESFARMNLSEDYKTYRINRGLNYYDKAIKSNLTKII